MSVVYVVAEQAVLLGRGARREHRGVEVAIEPQGAAEARGPPEALDHDAHRHAGRATLAGRPVGDVLAAAEAALRQRVMEGAGVRADEVGEHLALVLAGQIGAGRRRSDEKLRKVAPLDAHNRLVRIMMVPPVRLAKVRRKSMRRHLLGGDSRPPGASRTRVTNPCFSIVATISSTWRPSRASIMISSSAPLAGTSRNMRRCDTSRMLAPSCPRMVAILPSTPGRSSIWMRRLASRCSRSSSR